MLWRWPLRLFWWLFGGLIRTAVTLLLLFGVVYLVLRLTPLDEFWRARFYAKIGKTDEAEHWYRLGLQQYPRSRFAPQGHYELAELLFARGRYREAVGHFGKALEGGLTPEQKREALLKIAECFQQSGMPLDAARRFETFAKTFPDDERAAKALFAAGESYRQVDRADKARRCFEKISANYPASPFAPKALWALAELAEQKGDEQQALLLYRKLVERYPQSAEAAKANTRLALWHYQHGDYKAALKAYGDALKAAPQVLRDALDSEKMRQLWQQLKERAGELLQSSP
ncbi:Cell division coordinator CpoB [bacterium HR17]|uniref:Cell division coordinator CpoB n=1 Tax=Candidatus Fervidibacter japonicus TaxID=2035412 RepID=A0A2H5XAY4_9BACT|nr:Cell division coordinator CpoB [bacterium HR17]